MDVRYINIIEEYLPNIALAFSEDGLPAEHKHWFVIFNASEDDLKEISDKISEGTMLFSSNDSYKDYLITTNDDNIKEELDNFLNPKSSFGL